MEPGVIRLASFTTTERVGGDCVAARVPRPTMVRSPFKSMIAVGKIPVV